MRTPRTILPLVAVILGSCQMEESGSGNSVEPPATGDDAEWGEAQAAGHSYDGPLSATQASTPDPGLTSYRVPARNAVELQKIATELRRRAHARGYSLAQMQAAVDAHDEAASRDILGLSETELRAVHNRIRSLVEEPAYDYRSDDSPRNPPPWAENPHVEIRDSNCSLVPYWGCLAAAAWTSVSVNLGEALLKYILGSLVCMCGFCEGGINDYICPKLSGGE